MLCQPLKNLRDRSVDAAICLKLKSKDDNAMILTFNLNLGGGKVERQIKAPSKTLRSGLLSYVPSSRSSLHMSQVTDQAYLWFP